MNILEFNPDEIVLGSLDGKAAFVAQPSDTDVVELASAAWDALTPKQRALGVAENSRGPSCGRTSSRSRTASRSATCA